MDIQAYGCVYAQYVETRTLHTTSTCCLQDSKCFQMYADSIRFNFLVYMTQLVYVLVVSSQISLLHIYCTTQCLIHISVCVPFRPTR